MDMDQCGFSKSQIEIEMYQKRLFKRFWWKYFENTNESASLSFGGTAIQIKEFALRVVCFFDAFSFAPVVINVE